MAIPKRMLTRSLLKRQREAGLLDAETLTWLEQKVKLEEARKKRQKMRRFHKALHTQPVTGDPALITVTPAKGTPAYRAFKKFKKKINADRLANEPRKAEMETRKLLEASAAIMQRPPQPRPKRRSPRTGLAKFGLSIL